MANKHHKHHKHRVQLDLSARDYTRLSDLSDALDAPRTDIIRKGIHILHLLQPKVTAGARLLIESPDGSCTEIMLLM